MEVCARRELREETGLDLVPALVLDDEDWPVFLIVAAPDAEVRLSAEHDAYRWVDLAAALAMIRPGMVAEQVRRAAELFDAAQSSMA